MKNNLMIKTVSKFENTIPESKTESTPTKPQTAKVLKRLNKFSHPRMIKCNAPPFIIFEQGDLSTMFP